MRRKRKHIRRLIARYIERCADEDGIVGLLEFMETELLNEKQKEDYKRQVKDLQNACLLYDIQVANLKEEIAKLKKENTDDKRKCRAAEGIP